MTRDWKEEEQRQANIMGVAFHDAIMDAAKGFEQPLMNAVFGALAGVYANALSTIPAGRPRKAVREAFDRAVNQKLRTTPAGACGTAQVVNLDKMQ